MRNRTIHEVAFRLTFDVQTCMSPSIAKLGIDLSAMQLRAMRAIWSKKHATAQFVVSTLKRDKAQVSRLIDELCTRKLVCRIANPEDDRSKLLQLTDAGIHIFQQIENIERRVGKKMIKDIEKSDLATFFRVADQLSENMRVME
jgi:DNA-binding MarR family transcriptional regulator